MPRKSKAVDRIGDFYLKLFGGVWKICRANKKTGQVDKVTTNEREADIEAARAKLAEHAIRFKTVTDANNAHIPPDCSLRIAFACYKKDKEQLRSFKSAFLPVANRALEFFGPDRMLTTLTVEAQEAFVQELRHPSNPKRYDPWVDSTIDRGLGALWAAFKRAHLRRHTAYVPSRIPADLWGKRIVKTRKRLLTLQEIADFFNVAGDRSFNKDKRFSREHWWRYLVCAIGTLARPEAIRDLHSSQVDFDNKTLDLLPEGRAQNKKVRPCIPLAPTLAKWLHAWGRGHYITYFGMPLATMEFFDSMREVAGHESITAYMLRRFVRTWLRDDRQSKVPVWQADYVMGHVPDGSRTGHEYTLNDPSKMPEVVKSIERLYRSLAPLITTRALLQPAPEDFCTDGKVAVLPSPRMLGIRKDRRQMVRLEGVEPPTFRMSSERSTAELQPLSEGILASDLPVASRKLVIIQKKPSAPVIMSREGTRKKSNQNSQ